MKLYFWLNYSFIIFGHWLFFLLARHFIAPDHLGTVVLAIVIALLAISVPLSNWLIRYIKHDMFILRAFYFLSAFWMGSVLNFVLVAGLISLAGLFIPISHQAALIIWLSISIAADIIAYLLASSPRIRHEEAYIENLPESWENKKIAHVSDLHLGPIYRHRFFHKVMKKILKISPSALFVTGDLFDDIDLEFDWMGKLMNGFSIERGVYYSFGNHDLILGFEKVKDILGKEKIIILDNNKVEVDGLQIIGVDFSFDRKASLKQSLDSLGYEINKPSILLFHEPKSVDEAKDSKIGLMLSGHTHFGQMFPLNFLTSWFYKGYDHGMYHEDGYNLSVCVGTGTWGPPMRTNSRSEIVAITLKKKI